MGEATSISWCDHTWNGWRSCSHATLPDGTEHPGCLHCYAEGMSKRNPKVFGTWGDDSERVVGADAYWKLLAKWDKQWAGRERRGRVFCFSMGDVFEDRPELEMWREEFFDLIDCCQNLNFLCLTKRPQNIRRFWKQRLNEDLDVAVMPRNNVWLGTSISDQVTADAMIPELLECRDLSPVLFLSAEPLIGPIDFTLNRYPNPDGRVTEVNQNVLTGRQQHVLGAGGKVIEAALGGKIDWVIVGGESGRVRREMPMDAARSVVTQCRDAGVPIFIKQDSAEKPGEQGRWTDKEFAIKEFPNA